MSDIQVSPSPSFKPRNERKPPFLQRYYRPKFAEQTAFQSENASQFTQVAGDPEIVNQDHTPDSKRSNSWEIVGVDHPSPAQIEEVKQSPGLGENATMDEMYDNQESTMFQTLDIVLRRASLPGKSSTEVIMPAPTFEEWNVTKSCPATATMQLREPDAVDDDEYWVRHAETDVEHQRELGECTIEQQVPVMDNSFVMSHSIATGPEGAKHQREPGESTDAHQVPVSTVLSRPVFTGHEDVEHWAPPGESTIAHQVPVSNHPVIMPRPTATTVKHDVPHGKTRVKHKVPAFKYPGPLFPAASFHAATSVEHQAPLADTHISHQVPITNDRIIMPHRAITTTTESQIFMTLGDAGFFIPATVTLHSSSLILFKHDTPVLERFRLLHNQLFTELGRVSAEMLEVPEFGNQDLSAEKYKEKEEVMMGLLVETVPALNHLAETIGKVVGRSITRQGAGLRIWAGQRGESKKRPDMEFGM